MKKQRFPIIFLLGLALVTTTGIKPTYAQQIVHDPVNGGILGAIQGIQAAVQAWNTQIQNAIGTMNHNIASSLTDHMKKQQAAQADQAISQKMVDDRQKEFQQSQQATKEAAQLNGTALATALAKYQPSMKDCKQITLKAIKDPVSFAFKQQADAIFAADNHTSDAYLRAHGIPGGLSAYQATWAGNVAKAYKDLNSGNLTSADIPYLDPMQAATNPGGCVTTSDPSQCYNQAVTNKYIGIMIGSMSDRAPWSAVGNSQMNVYFAQRNKWENDRSGATETVRKILPRMFKHKSYYDQAFADLTAAFITSPSPTADIIQMAQTEAKGTLEADYPNSSKLGLSEYELQEAEFYAATAAGETLVRAADNSDQRDRASTMLQGQAAELQIAKMERDEFEAAVKELGFPAPAVNASALSITTTK